MGTAIVATATVSDLPALKDQLANLPVGDTSYYLLQCPIKITDWEKGPINVAEAEIEKYVQGRLFGKEGEIRWKKTAEGYSLLWLSTGEPPESFKPLDEIEWEMTKPQNVFLLGGGDTKPWRDTRIPRELDYPIAWCKYPKVKIIQYRDSISQIVRFARYTEFVDK